MKAHDAELLHTRGRLSYAVAHLSWLERTMCRTFYKKLPPVLTYDDAIADFLEVWSTLRFEENPMLFSGGESGACTVDRQLALAVQELPREGRPQERSEVPEAGGGH